ncbi:MULTISPECIES: phosphatidate cytidylyltransferase [Pontibacillus]|uniref:Phosphatidate cytidylyltransferase n=1 Tax=Pontibacillus chungwhensis TaxID=265426 RepID=A0ABY8V2Y0_9BACI|nr:MULTISPECIES: phosphatidate cytidylyltransferase [Pontibacillus]MCD5322717.1 phosphatidate cytidylyltransferase [Pontibacillus sp. HN14]WIF99993.1 phosphatidate cytidylyltransferase [Pontibacillus chungwhensis]
MKQRIVTAIIFGLLIIPIFFFGQLPFVILIYGFATIGLAELMRMRRISPISFPGVISFVHLWVLLAPEETFSGVVDMTKAEFTLLAVFILLGYTVLVKNKFTFDETGFLLLSAVYVGMGFYYLIATRNVEDFGVHYVFFTLLLIWATDTGAFFFGKFLGKRKLWPQISPKKTIEGSLGGILLACVVAVVFQLLVPLDKSMFVVIAGAVLIAVFGQIGDLVESAYKRHYSVKDSGKLLPGHGGVLDRFDSLIFVLPILHFIQFIS